MIHEAWSTSCHIPFYERRHVSYGRTRKEQRWTGDHSGEGRYFTLQRTGVFCKIMTIFSHDVTVCLSLNNKVQLEEVTIWFGLRRVDWGLFVSESLRGVHVA